MTSCLTEDGKSLSVIHAAGCGPLADAVNHRSCSKLFVYIHPVAMITRRPALNICSLEAVATELANMDVYQQPPHS